VNDSFGDATGDQLLRCVADGLRTITSSVSHAWLARLESDSFAIALPGLDAAPIRSFVASLQERLALATAHREDLPVRMTVCVGVALAEAAHGWDPHQLLQQANTALTQARRRGSGRLAFYDPAVSLAIERRLVLEQLLEQALQAPDPTVSTPLSSQGGPSG